MFSDKHSYGLVLYTQVCDRSDEYFDDSKTITGDTSTFSATKRLAHKCVSLKFLIVFFEKVVQPYRENMTVKEVVEEIIKPFTSSEQCSFIDKVRPNMLVAPHAFISHAFNNPINIIVNNLKNHFKDAVHREIYIWIDIYIINQHKPGIDLHGGDTLKATIEASESVVVCLDKDTKPLSRLWCLYEIGSTPIEKLILQTHGMESTEISKAYSKIDATKAECYAASDKTMIQEHIKTMMIDQNVVDDTATIEDSLKAFTRVLKLLLILKPMSYSADMTVLLERCSDYKKYPLKEKVEQACTGGVMICITGESGDGKSTLAAALAKTIKVDAKHFCMKADVRRQDRGLVIRSLSHQLAIKYPIFARFLLTLKPLQVESLADDAIAWKLLLQEPLIAAAAAAAADAVAAAAAAADAVEEAAEAAKLAAMGASTLSQESTSVGIKDQGKATVSKSSQDSTSVAISSSPTSQGNASLKEGRSSLPTMSSSAVVPPLFAKSFKDVTILIDSLDESGSDGKIISLLVDIDNLQLETKINFIVTTRPEDKILDALRSHWKGKLVELVPSELRGEMSNIDDNKSPLFLSLIRSIEGTPPDTLDKAYASIFGIIDEYQRSVLEVILASYQPQSLSDLMAMDLLKKARQLPRYGELFLERDNKLHLLHRSISDWLLKPEGGHIVTKRGHEQLAEHIWKTTLKPWLLPSKSDVYQRPSTGSYALKYALDHLREAGRIDEIEVILFRLPWLQGMLKEKGLGALMKDMMSLMAIPSLVIIVKKLISVLRLSSSALRGSDGWKYLPTQLFCRLRESEEDPFFSLREESKSWQKSSKGGFVPLKCVLHTQGSFEMKIEFDDDASEIFSISTLPDGRIISCSDDKLCIWNTVTGVCDRKLCSTKAGLLGGHSDWVRSVIALSDGRLVSCSDDKTLRLWNVMTGDCERVFKGHKGIVYAVISISNDRIVSCSGDKTLRIWNIREDEQPKVLSGHKARVRSVIALSNNRLVSCSEDHTLRMWNDQNAELERVFSGHNAGVFAVIAVSNDLLVSCSVDKTIRIWHATTGECVRVLTGHEDWVRSVISISEGRIVSCSDDKTLRVWNLLTGNCDRVLSGHEDQVRAVIGLPDNRMVSCSTDKCLCLWDIDKGNFDKLTGHSQAVKTIIHLSDGSIVSCSNDKTLRIWNSVIVNKDSVLSEHTGMIRSVIAISNDRLVSCSDDNTLRMWNATTGSCTSVFRGHKAGVNSVTALSDDYLVSCSDDKTLRIWYVATGDCIRVLKGHTKAAKWVISLSDGRLISSSDDKTLRIWNAVAGEQVIALIGHEGVVNAVAELTGGRIVSCSKDKSLRIWNVESGECSRVLSDHKAAVLSVIYVAQDRFISRDKVNMCYIWSVNGDEFRKESIPLTEYNRLTNGLPYSGELDKVAWGYEVDKNCVYSQSLGRIFVDECVEWVVKVADVVAVFEENGKDHWFKEVSLDIEVLRIFLSSVLIFFICYIFCRLRRV